MTQILIAAMIVAALLAQAVPTTTPGAGQPMMNAIVMREFGKADVLKLEQVPRPVPGNGQMLLRVRAASVNPIDWKLRSNPRGRMPMPYTPGFDVSGVVESLGPGVTKFTPGDEVFAMLDLRRGGAYAEYAIVTESEAATKPAKTSHVEAAAMPLVALTAWQALFDNAKLEPGQSILIHGGAGGVGSVAVQLAKRKGAKVYATASENNLDFLRQLGADVAIDYRSQKFEDIAKDVDVVLDTVGGDTQARSWGVLKKGGILVSIVGGASQDKAREAGVRAAGMLVRVNADELGQIAKLVDEGKLKAVVSQELPLADAAKAQELSETRHTRGKIVLKVAD
jgi:NADPH:quinone reductase-like Zn-dependent oxidoreductase